MKAGGTAAGRKTGGDRLAPPRPSSWGPPQRQATARRAGRAVMPHEAGGLGRAAFDAGAPNGGRRPAPSPRAGRRSTVGGPTVAIPVTGVDGGPPPATH